MAKAGTELDFGQLARDPSDVPIQFPTKFSTLDGAGTKLSPLAYAAVVLTLVVPNDAVWMSISPTTDLRVSEDSTMSHYDIVPSGGRDIFYVALLANIYIVQDSVTGIARFRFARV